MLRSYEDFLVHPTYVLPLERELPRRSAAPALLASPSRRYSCSHMLDFAMDHTRPSPGDASWRLAKQSMESMATVRPFENEQAFAHGYTSEEEAASPLDGSDGSSLRSMSDSSSNCSVIAQPAAPVAKAVQLSNRAQAVQLVAAGKVKVISMPRVTESPKSPALPRPSTTSWTTPPPEPAGLPRHKREWSGSSTKSSSPRQSTSLRSSRPLSCVGPPVLDLNTHIQRRRPSLPAIMTVSTSPSAPAPLTPARTARQPDFLQHDPFPTAGEPPKTPLSPTSPSARRRMPKFISKIIKRRETTPLEGVPELPVSCAPATSKLKMIARGADEIEPTIRLPPCPRDYAPEDRTPWLLSKDAAPFATSAAARPHKRARSVMI
nr:hypothetical protein CFP56_46749 [Quercus suber]